MRVCICVCLVGGIGACRQHSISLCLHAQQVHVHVVDSLWLIAPQGGGVLCVYYWYTLIVGLFCQALPGFLQLAPQNFRVLVLLQCRVLNVFQGCPGTAAARTAHQMTQHLHHHSGVRPACYMLHVTTSCREPPPHDAVRADLGLPSFP